MHRDWIWFSPIAVSCTSVTKRLCQMPTQRCWELRAKETGWEGGQVLFVVFYVLSWDKQHVIRVLYRSKCSCVNPTWLQVTTCHTELCTYCIFHGGHMKLFTHWFVHFEPCIHDAPISSVASLPFNHQAVKELASGNLGTGTCALESAECMCLFLFMHTQENSLYIYILAEHLWRSQSASSSQQVWPDRIAHKPAWVTPSSNKLNQTDT